MDRALGMMEFKTVVKGIEGMDIMVKTAKVKIMRSHTLCPGRYIVLIKGELGAVKAAVEGCNKKLDSFIRNTYILGNPHKQLYEGLNDQYDLKQVKAMGIIETNAIPAILKAADQSLKAAEVNLAKIMLGNHIGGKGVLVITGELAAVEEALQHASSACEESNTLVDFTIIPRPDQSVWDAI